MIAFFVHGTPRPAGSKRAFPIYKGRGPSRRFTGRVAVTDDCVGSRDWKTNIHAAALMAYHQKPMAGPVRLSLTFIVRRPGNRYGSGRNRDQVRATAPPFPTVRPDVLKLARAVEDALTDVLWCDDAQIVSETLRKRYAGRDEMEGVQIECNAEVAP